MGLWDSLLKIAPLALGGAATLASGGAAAPLEAGLMGAEGAGAGLGAAAGGDLAGLGAGALGEATGEMAPAMVPNLSEVTPPMPMPQPMGEPPGLPPAPTSPGMPTDWQSHMKGAHGALRFASKLIPNKDAKNTLNLMALGTGAGMNVSDPAAAMESMGGPLGDIASSQQQELSKQRLSQAAPVAPPAPAPMPKPQITQASPATARGMGTLPPARLTGDPNAMSAEQRLMMLRGY